MGYEDYRPYTEVDHGDCITVNENFVSALLGQGFDRYLYDDKGVGHFGDFEHLVDVYFDGYGAQTSLGDAWLLANQVDDEKALRAEGQKFLSANLYWDMYNTYLRAGYWDGSAFNKDAYLCALDTWYYLTIKRDGTSFTVKIYNNSDRAVGHLVDTLSLTVTTDAFRYIYGVINYTTADDNRYVDIDVRNLDLQEAVGGLSIPVAMHHYNRINKIIRG